MIASVTPRELEILVKSLANKQAVRIGETTVASTCVHTLNPKFDGTVYVNHQADAGRFFYKRNMRGEVVHLDIFHEPGLLSHKKVFESLKQEIKRYQQIYEISSAKYNNNNSLADYIDIITATGGGRITGSGKHNRSRRIKENHRNHCHVSILLEPHDYRALFHIVDAVETVIINQQLKLHKVSSIVYEKNDLSLQHNDDFEFSSDSLLNSEKNQKRISPKETKKNYTTNFPDYLKLEQEQIAVIANYEWLATESYFLSDYYQIPDDLDYDFALKNKRKNVEKVTTYKSELKGAKQLFVNKNNTVRKYGDFSLSYTRQSYQQAYRSKHTRHLPKGGSLAVASTVKRALVSRYQHHQGKGPLKFTEENLRYYQRPKQSYQEFLFLIDCSASMKGARIHAASVLVDRILSWSRDKVAVISIQENNTRLQCPLTRNRQQIQNAVSNLRPYGLTPLAEGIELAYEYIIRNRLNKVEVVLISDGIPTVSRYGDDPVSEAEIACSMLAKENISFLCIGMQPNRHIMGRIAAAGKGHLYITKDLQADILLRIFRREHEVIKHA